MFLSPLTARSKIREVLRGLVATRQVHTLTLGHAPHFYVAGTLPEFTPAPTIYASSLGSSYLLHVHDREESYPEPEPAVADEPEHASGQEDGVHAASNGRSSAVRPHFARSSNHARDRKPSTSPTRRAAENRSSRSSGGGRPGSSPRWAGGSKNTSHNGNGHTTGHTGNGHSAGHNGNGHAAGAKAEKPSGTERATNGARGAKASAPAWKSRNGNHAAGPGKKSGASRPAAARPGAARPAAARKDARAGGAAARSTRKPGLAAASSGKRFGLSAKGTKKHG